MVEGCGNDRIKQAKELKQTSKRSGSVHKMDINTAIVSVTSASSTNVACPHVCRFGKHEATRPCPSVPGIPLDSLYLSFLSDL
jgi:hypothetical protein